MFENGGKCQHGQALARAPLAAIDETGASILLAPQAAIDEDGASVLLAPQAAIDENDAMIKFFFKSLDILFCQISSASLPIVSNTGGENLETFTCLMNAGLSLKNLIILIIRVFIMLL